MRAYPLIHLQVKCCNHYNHQEIYIVIEKSNVKYKRTDALSLWHQQYSTTVDIHGPLQARGETRCPGGVSVSCYLLNVLWDAQYNAC